MPNVKQLQKMAKTLNVKNRSRLAKSDLIRAIQKAEGHSPCYGQIDDCGQDDCLFWVDCMGKPSS